MKKSIILIVLTIFLASCSAASPTFTPTLTETASMPQQEASPSSSPLTTPTSTITPTGIPEREIVVLTHETPDQVLTAVNLQLEEKVLELTAAAEQLSTLEAEANLLKTQVVKSEDSANDDENDNSNNNNNNNNNNNDGFDVPSNVYVVVTTQKAVVYITKRNNDAGYPIMEPYVPRVKLEPARKAWVYKSSIRADGNDTFYESYDPDGNAELKVYFRAQDIQIKLDNGSPSPTKYPSNVAVAEFREKSLVWVQKGTDDGGKPIMVIYEPRIKYQGGEEELVIPKVIIGTGGTHFFAIYDPDGKSSAYVREKDVLFPLFWD